VNAAEALRDVANGLRKDHQFAVGEFCIAQNKRMRCQPWKDLATRIADRIEELDRIVADLATEQPEEKRNGG
jgi:hypothetical protein